MNIIKLFVGKMLKRVQHDGTRAFTLAEVLVTLAIIGVVASLTIPAVMKNVEVSKNRTAAKTAFSLLSETIKLMEVNDNLPDFATDYGAGFRNNFCSETTCVKTGLASDFLGTYYHYNSSSGIDWSANTSPVAFLKNGMIAIFGGYADNCTETLGTITTGCGSIYIDTNGLKNPNMYGKDMLRFHLARRNSGYFLFPAGAFSSAECNPAIANAYYNNGCTAYYIEGKELP